MNPLQRELVNQHSQSEFQKEKEVRRLVDQLYVLLRGSSPSESASSTENPEETTALRTDILRLVERINSWIPLGDGLRDWQGQPRITVQTYKTEHSTNYLIMVEDDPTGPIPPINVGEA